MNHNDTKKQRKKPVVPSCRGGLLPGIAPVFSDIVLGHSFVIGYFVIRALPKIPENPERAMKKGRNR